MSPVASPDASDLQPVELLDMGLNVPPEDVRANIAHAIRLGLPQARPHQPNQERLALVGGGPSLVSTFDELRAQAFAGVKFVAMNGSYSWLLERNLRPAAMVLLDGRAWNARFLTERVPGCKYFLASQCAPDVFERVREWDNEIYVFHVSSQDSEQEVLRAYYGDRYQLVIGGSTVMLRTIGLFRMLGFQWLDVYGFDSCVLEDQAHAYSQPENDADLTTTIFCGGRAFRCTAWQISQAQDFMGFVRLHGDAFHVRVHGHGLIAHLLQHAATLQTEQKE